ncbi:hypothetical protein GBAR_LOCUS14263 [Geodia barretti]|uniref:Uncharacterized protein n=1 Tax=Geodia barretti TaxID=519541 RepID=A0AA35S6W0_GEOBA|nr:hypothetical protein GBAR_LOCUS14263 [Geodia barretti]
MIMGITGSDIFCSHDIGYSLVLVIHCPPFVHTSTGEKRAFSKASHSKLCWGPSAWLQRPSQRTSG